MEGLLPVVSGTKQGLANAGTYLRVPGSGLNVLKWYLLMEVGNIESKFCEGYGCLYSNVTPLFFRLGCSFINNVMKYIFTTEGSYNLGLSAPIIKYKKDESSNKVKFWIFSGMLTVNYYPSSDIRLEEPPEDALVLEPNNK